MMMGFLEASGRLTSDVFQVLHPSHCLDSIAPQLSPLRPTVLGELLQVDAHLFERRQRVLDGEVHPSGMLGVFGA